jgi:hypothetical protein
MKANPLFGQLNPGFLWFAWLSNSKIGLRGYPNAKVAIGFFVPHSDNVVLYVGCALSPLNITPFNAESHGSPWKERSRLRSASALF